MCADPEQQNVLPKPVACLAQAQSMSAMGGGGVGGAGGIAAAAAGGPLTVSMSAAGPGGSTAGEPCTSQSFVQVGSECRDYQEIRIQEQVSKLTMGSMPRSMLVALENDLVDAVKPGDEVVVNGVVMRRWKPVSNDDRCDVELYLHANYVHIANAKRAANMLR